MRFTRETKFVDNVISESVTTATWTNGAVKDVLLTIVQGVEESQRIGRKITIKSIMFHMSYCVLDVENATAPIKGARIRTVVYIDRQTNKATTTTLDLWEDDDLFSFRNLTNSKRFKILHDKVTPLNERTLTENTDNLYSMTGFEVSHDIYITGLNLHVEYTGSTGTVGQRTGNNIGIIHVLEDAAAANSRIEVEVSGNCRVRYSDA